MHEIFRLISKNGNADKIICPLHWDNGIHKHYKEKYGFLCHKHPNSNDGENGNCPGTISCEHYQQFGDFFLKSIEKYEEKRLAKGYR